MIIHFSNPRLKFRSINVIAFTVFAVTVIASASSEKKLKALAPTSGIYPYGAVTFDTSGNIYASASTGGGALGQDQGTVFVLQPNANSGWVQSTLFAFKAPKLEGGVPKSNVVLDMGGNLYGTTAAGGLTKNGTVYKLTPTSQGQWTESLLHAFNGDDGDTPNDLTIDGQNDLYGTTQGGGSLSNGVVFEIAADTGAYSVLYNFGLGNNDGKGPSGKLFQDSTGNLYGTTEAGGKYGYGVVFKLSPAGSGWNETIVYNFGVGLTDAKIPVGGVVMNGSGDIYGTTCYGGSELHGTVFVLSLSDEVWTEQIIHNFGVSEGDGHCPLGAPLLDDSGNIFGTTISGGAKNQGTVFELSPSVGGGQWTGKILHNFNGGSDGAGPSSGLAVDGLENLYGTTTSGGKNNGGIVYQITP